MVDIVWFFLMAAGIGFAAFFSGTDQVVQALFDTAQAAPRLILELLGTVCFWTGMMKIAGESGLLSKAARLFAPLLRLLFPELPRNDPAFEPILMNFTANLLGVGNAATSFGLQAMDRLQQSNPHPEQVTDAMITLLLLNTGCITLLPSTVMGLRAAAGSADPGCILLPTLLASSTALFFSLTVHRLLALSLRRRRL